ncbi:FGGY family carbohydrate kinase [Microbacterium sp. 5K110]|jgi:xylulokinase|uniref:FGGY family carbohydrate kinase n=1 Tax=unclassified Microbacterium TaxID=2609290 RepID=UPI00148598C9|nr:FGGY family carbohydrate kinase [Microbacterium sp. 5K110]
MRDELLLGIDLGTSSIKANAIDRHGRSIGIGVAPTPFATSAHGVEMSTEALFSAIQAAIADLGVLATRVAAVGVASMGETGTIIRPDGPSDLPLVAWHDSRGAEIVDAVTAHFGSEEIYRRTGRAPRSVTSIAKLGWLLRNGHRTGGTWTGVAGLTLWRLTGALAQEQSLAASSGAFDPLSGEYDREILSFLGLDSLVWAPARIGGTAFGRVSAEGAGWSGLRAGIPVTIAGHDHPVGVIGAGGDHTEVIDSMGTGEPLVVAWAPATDAVRTHPRWPDQFGDLTITAWPGTSRHMLLWETLRPGLAMRHLRHALRVDRDDIEFAAIGVEAAPLPLSVLLDLQEGVVSEEIRTLAPEVAWAGALEGYAETSADAERRLRALSGVSGQTLLIGGGLRSRRWVEAKIRRTRHPVAMAQEREAVSRGAGLLAGVAAGWWEPEKYPPADAVPLAPVEQAALARGHR